MRTPATIPLAILAAALALSGSARARLSKSRSPAPPLSLSLPRTHTLQTLTRSLAWDSRPPHWHSDAPATVLLPRDGRKLEVGDGNGDTVSTGALENNNPEVRMEVSKAVGGGGGGGGGESTTEKLDQCMDVSGANACASDASASEGL